jgi:hypothetical protein
LSISADLDDAAAGWLLSEGLQLDTPGPVNLMTQQQQQQQGGLAGGAAAAAASLPCQHQQQLSHLQQLEYELQQMQAGLALQQQQQQHGSGVAASGCWGAAAKAEDAAADRAVRFTAGCSSMPQLQQELPYFGQQVPAAAAANGDAVHAAAERTGGLAGYKQGSGVVQPAASLAAAAVGSQALGSDKDDLALLQALLGWGGNA